MHAVSIILLVLTIISNVVIRWAMVVYSYQELIVDTINIEPCIISERLLCYRRNLRTSVAGKMVVNIAVASSYDIVYQRYIFIRWSRSQFQSAAGCIGRIVFYLIWLLWNCSDVPLKSLLLVAISVSKCTSVLICHFDSRIFSRLFSDSLPS